MPIRPMIAFGCALVVMTSTACRLDAQTRPEGIFERTVAVSGPLTLDIRTSSGSIQIRRGPKDTVHVLGRVRTGRSWFRNDRNAEERIRRIEQAPPIAQTGDTIRIGSNGDDSLFRNISISYDVTVPMDTQVQSHTASGSQTIGDLRGPVDASATSGRIELRAIVTDVRASTASGGIQVEDVGGLVGRATSGRITATAVRGAIDVRTGSGRINVGQTGEADVNAQTVSGRIAASGLRGALRARAGSGSIEIQGTPMANWEVETTSGRIRIVLPEDSAFDLNVRTTSGLINTSHPLAVVGALSGNQLQGTVRGGGARVDLSTGSGSVQIN